MSTDQKRSTEQSLSSLETELRGSIRGEVYFDQVSQGIYATDASHYQVMPACVVVPRDARDAVQAIRVAADHRLPITARGGGTSLSGQTTWTGMVLDFSKYMDRLVELDVDGQWARVQPGLVRDSLNSIVQPHQLHFAPDPATGNRATIGGMIGNNASGTRSIVYGKTIDHVIETTIALADGTVLTFSPTDRNRWAQIVQHQSVKADIPDLRGTSPALPAQIVQRQTVEEEIYRGVQQILEENRDEIEARFPKVMRRVSGYNLDAFGTTDPWNLAHLIVGSEGTLAVLLEAKVKLTPLPKATVVCVVHFDDVIGALRAVDPILQHGPSAVELLDDVILTEARRNRATASMADFLDGEPGAVQVVELSGDSADEVQQRVDTLVADLRAKKIGWRWPIRTDARSQANVWNVRKLGLGLISNVRGPRKGQAFVEDACVPVKVLPQYIAELKQICQRLDVPLSIYGHASVGVLHVRPMLDLHLDSDVAKMKQIADAAFPLVVGYQGAWSGEHGDGLVRGQFIEPFFGPKLYEAFRQIKALFDPHGLMNPGKIVDSPPMTEHLRYGRSYKVAEVHSNYHYREQGGFALAVEQCNGVGACRKTGDGTMCPSYMATRDEEHTTRGRANALRLAMSGQLGQNALAGERMQEVLKLCLSCKACKAECPNSVDMAKLKSDVLQMRYDQYGVPLAARLVGAMPAMARRFSGWPAPFVNWVQRRGPFKSVLQKMTGIDRRRTLPAYARTRFDRWFVRHRSGRAGDETAMRPGRTVVLFDDTFMNYFEPQIGRAAVQLLESCGYHVVLARAGCCQRPRLSKGLVRVAKRDGAETLQNLQHFAQKGWPILVCEPSCASALIDDLPDLVDDESLGRRVVPQVMMLETFLTNALESGQFVSSWRSHHKKALLHGHCHQKALFGTHAVKTFLERVDGLQVSEVDSGCCGMAGSFGYEQYDLSMKIGQDRLFPAIRDSDPDTVVVASGTSCRNQILDACGIKARHWVEVLGACTRSDRGSCRSLRAWEKMGTGTTA